MDTKEGSKIRSPIPEENLPDTQEIDEAPAENTGEQRPNRNSGIVNLCGARNAMGARRVGSEFSARRRSF